MFGTVCPLSVMPDPEKELLQLADQDISDSAATSGWLVAAANTLVQLRSRPQLRGRIMGIWTMALPGGYPVTALIVALVAGINARAVLPSRASP
jgi:hypothetical protein